MSQASGMSIWKDVIIIEGACLVEEDQKLVLGIFCLWTSSGRCQLRNGNVSGSMGEV